VLLKGHPSPQPVLGGARAHNLLSLLLNPKHVCSSPLTLSDWRLGAQTVDTSNQFLVHLPGCCCTKLHKAYNYEWDLWLGASSGSSGPAPRMVTCYYQHLFLQNSLHIAMDATGPTIDISNSGGGRCRTCRQHPQGARHRRLQLWWWPLPNLPTAPPGGRHRCLQLWWWPLPDLPTAPPGVHPRCL
jgi:hypothetical protein